MVVNLWHRKQGLILKQGNSLGIKGLKDVIEKKARFVNRNEGSGTRMLLEYLLKEKGWDNKEITSFANEVNTHLGVALKIFFGEADAGLGIEYVAHLFSLDFVPLKEERFDLVVPRELWSTKVIQGLIAYIDPVQISRLSRTLPGYNLKDTGKIIFES